MQLAKIKNAFLIFSWALYDLANQFFALNVVSLYFVRWLILEKQKPEILYSISFGISTFFVALFGLILGAISDKLARRKPFLVYLSLLSIIFTMLLGIDKGVFWALIFFALANFGCSTATVFYNALLINIAPVGKIGFVSGLGKMFGYSGAVLALYLIKPIVLKSGYQATFLPTGLLFFIFSLPCLIFVKDKISQRISLASFLKKEVAKGIFKDLKNTVLDTDKYPGLLDFLKGTFFALSAVNAIILFMSVYATQVFALNEAQVIGLITFSTFFALAGSLISGFLSDYLGHKRLLCAIFVLWIACMLTAAVVSNMHFCWLIGACAGTALGSTWVVSRALAIRLVPQEKMGEVFGLFNLVGYISAIVGSLFWGLVVLVLSDFGKWSYRCALLSLILFISLGFIFLLRIKLK